MDLGLVQELFNPAAKHAEDERRRLDHTRVAEDHHPPGCGPVDLDSGTVLVAPGEGGMVLPPRVRAEEYAEDDGDEPEA